jgi:hypothetical protein
MTGPCLHGTFDSGGWQNDCGWLKHRDDLREWVWSRTNRGGGVAVLLQSDDHLTFLWTDQPQLPGAHFYRIVRIGVTEWLVYSWRAGYKTDAHPWDPPVSALRINPQEWPRREALATLFGKRSEPWLREAVRCPHRAWGSLAGLPAGFKFSGLADPHCPDRKELDVADEILTGIFQIGLHDGNSRIRCNCSPEVFRAVQCIDAALMRDPHNPWLLTAKGVVVFFCDPTHAAKGYFEQALAVKPDLLEARMALDRGSSGGRSCTSHGGAKRRPNCTNL